MNNLNQKNLVEQFIDGIDGQQIIMFDAAFLPFTIFFDWLSYYDSLGNINEVKPLFLHKMPNGMSKGYINDSQYSRAAEEGLKSYLNDNKYIVRVESRYHELTSDIDFEYVSIFENNPVMSEEETMLLVKKLHKELVEMTVITLPIERVDKAIISKICGSSVDLEKVWKISELPSFESFEIKNSRYILEVLNNKKNIDLLRYIHSSYTFLPSKQDVESEVLKVNQNDLVQRIKESEELVLENKEKRDLEIKSLNDKEREILQYIDWVMQTRDDRKAYICKSEIQLAVLCQKLFLIWGLDPNLVAYASILEIVKGKDYVVANINKIKARMSPLGYTLLYLGDNSEIVQSTDDLSADIKRLDDIVMKQHVSEEVNILKGEVGSRGKVTGTVRIILSPSEFGNFKKGEVLVAPMTRPEYVPLMRQSIAIVTDEGGITCHAAIVSRELKLPCIIGTKIATKVLKDGDLVEVDANLGVIKIIK